MEGSGGWRMKIGAITIGQAPREDVTCDIMDLLGAETELLQAGGLDGLTKEEISAFAPCEGDYVLISKLRDGTSVTFAERCILPKLQGCIDKLEAEGVKLILFFCTGEFPDCFRSSVPLIFPYKLLRAIVPVLLAGNNLAVITPKPEQIAQTEEKWKESVALVKAYAASPYGDPEELTQAAALIRDTDAAMIVLDCIGYTSAMKKAVEEISQKPVILSRTLLARTAGELLA